MEERFVLFLPFLSFLFGRASYGPSIICYCECSGFLIYSFSKIPATVFHSWDWSRMRVFELHFGINLAIELTELHWEVAMDLHHTYREGNSSQNLRKYDICYDFIHVLHMLFFTCNIWFVFGNPNANAHSAWNFQTWLQI